MQKDFHFYAVSVLARAAGFDADDALIIGYASQYVDDSTESELIQLDIDGSDIKFDPVRSAYDGLDIVESVQWSAQKRVWIPFHFIPPKPFSPRKIGDFSFVTKPDSEFGRMLLEAAVKARNHKYRLCAIGIATHTFADTWSHQRFSGRQNRYENDAEKIEVRPNGRYQTLLIENALFDVLPQVGHAETGLFPDLAYIRWRYRAPDQKTPVKRDNPAIFMEAAKTIYQWFRDHTENQPLLEWTGELAPEIEKLLKEDLKEEPDLENRLTIPLYKAFHRRHLDNRCREWKKTFNGLFASTPRLYSYNPQEWRKEAIDGQTDWDKFSSRDWDREGPFKVKSGFWDSLWVHFHRAALRQRHFVLENMP